MNYSWWTVLSLHFMCLPVLILWKQVTYVYLLCSIFQTLYSVLNVKALDIDKIHAIINWYELDVVNLKAKHLKMIWHVQRETLCILTRVSKVEIGENSTAGNERKLSVWKHLHILFYHLGLSNNWKLCWIWCIWRKIAKMYLFIGSFSWKYNRYHDYISVYTDGSRDDVFHQTLQLCMQLPDSASIFTVEIRAFINLKLWSKLKILLHPNIYIFYGLFLVSLGFTLYEAWTSLGWDGDMKVSF